MANPICRLSPRLGRRFLSGRALLLIALAIGPAQAESISENTFAQIDAAIFRGDIETAERLADAALLSPRLSKRDESLLLSDRALARSLNGQPLPALGDYNKAIGTQALPIADQVTALLERGLLKEMLSKLKSALGDYTAVLQLRPNSATALNRRAHVYFRLGQITASQRDYLAALEANSETPERAYFGLGQIAEGRGDLAGASSYFGKALAANPNFVAATDSLGHLNAISAEGAHNRVKLPADQGPGLPQTTEPPAKTSVSIVRPNIVPMPSAKRHQTNSATPRLRPAIASRHERTALRSAQLGAWRSEDEAAGGWVLAVKRAGKLLAGVEPSIVPVDLAHKGQYFRLRIKIAESPNRFCEALITNGVSCIPVAD